MKQSKKDCRFNGTQWAMLSFLVVIGMLLFLNAKPYREEWKNDLNPLQIGFLQDGAYTMEITYENSPGNNHIVVWTDEMADEHNQMGIILAEQEINEGSGVVRIPLALDIPMYGVCVRTILDEEDGGYLTKVLIQSNSLIYKDNYVLAVMVMFTGVLLAVWFWRMNRALDPDGIWAEQKLFLGYPERYMMPLVLAGLGLLASLPLFSDAVLWGDDTAFHLVRLEGIYQGMRTGDFPVRITPQQMAGYGSLTASMYPQLFLYPVALLRFMGVSLMLSYKILLVFINIATAFGAYYAAVNICDSRKTGLWMSILYTFSAYRLSNLYVRGALGESLAMVFLPLVIWGVYEVLWGKGRWMVLVLGMTGMLESHVLSTQLCILFMGAELIFWLFCRKKQQFGKRFWNGCKAVLVTLLLNASFLVPFLYFCGEDFQCFDMPLETFEHAAYFSQLFSLFLPVEGASLGLGTTRHEMPVTIGGVLLAGVILFLFLSERMNHGLSGMREKGLLERSHNGQGRKAVGMHCFVYGGIALVLSSWIFPGERLAQVEILRTFFTSLQFSWRFLGPATVCWSLAAAIGIVGVAEGAYGCILLRRVGSGTVKGIEFTDAVKETASTGKAEALEETESVREAETVKETASEREAEAVKETASTREAETAKETASAIETEGVRELDGENRMSRTATGKECMGGCRMIYGIMAVLVIISTLYFFDHLAQERDQRADKMELEGMSDGDGMYLYRDSEKFRAIQLDYHRNEAVIRTNQGGGMKYADYRKEGSHIHVEVTPVGKGADVLMFPLYWFPGYEVTVNGENVSAFPKDTFVSCKAPTEKAVVEVRYEGFLSFKLADIVTLATFCGILGRLFYVSRKDSGRRDDTESVEAKLLR